MTTIIVGQALGLRGALSPAPQLLLALALIFPALYAQQPAADPDALLQHAVALHQSGDLDGAIRPTANT